MRKEKSMKDVHACLDKIRDEVEKVRKLVTYMGGEPPKKENKKYELTDITDIIEPELTVYRIRACKDFETINGRTVHAGNLGGWVVSEDNLAQDGNCWVDDEAVAMEAARVLDDAILCGHATARLHARVDGRKIIDGWNEVIC